MTNFKGKRERVRLTIPRWAGETLAAWIEARGAASGPLFTSIGKSGRIGGRLTGDGVRYILATIGASVGVKVRPHGLRHTAITALLDSGADVRDVQKFSRHADLNTLLTYDDNREDKFGKMAAIVDAHSQLASALPRGDLHPRPEGQGEVSGRDPPIAIDLAVCGSAAVEERGVIAGQAGQAMPIVQFVIALKPSHQALHRWVEDRGRFGIDAGAAPDRLFRWNWLFARTALSGRRNGDNREGNCK